MLALFDRAGITYRLSGKNVGKEFVNICCPFCGEERYHCGIHRKAFWFRCWVCDAHGVWSKIKSQLERKYKGADWNQVQGKNNNFYLDEEDKQVEEVEKNQWRKFNLKTDYKIFNWLTSHPKDLKENYRFRGIPLANLDRFEIFVGYGKLMGYVLFSDGENVVGRRYLPDEYGSKWYKTKGVQSNLFGGNQLKGKQGEVVYLCEGIFDLLSLPINSVAVLGNSLTESLQVQIVKNLEGFKRLFLVFDRDVSANKLADMSLSLTDLGFVVDIFNWNEIPSEYKHIKDIDELRLTSESCYQSLFNQKNTSLLL